MFLQTEDIWNALKQKLETLSQNLSDDRRRLAACIHEAGHEIYLRDAGFKNILYCPPSAILVDGKPEITWASVQVNVHAERIPLDFLAKAKICAAGKACKEALRDVRENGHEMDYKALHDYIREQAGPDATEQEVERLTKHFWDEGEKAVSRDLTSPDFQREIWKTAFKIHREVYGFPHPEEPNPKKGD